LFLQERTDGRHGIHDRMAVGLGANVYTYPADLSGTPTLTLPVGFSEGLPLSMQIAGQPLSEPTLCRIGHAYEEATAGTRSTRASRLRWRRWISGLHDVVFLKWMAK